jgi:hypothetical protein
MRGIGDPIYLHENRDHKHANLVSAVRVTHNNNNWSGGGVQWMSRRGWWESGSGCPVHRLAHHVLSVLPRPQTHRPTLLHVCPMSTEVRETGERSTQKNPARGKARGLSGGLPGPLMAQSLFHRASHPYGHPHLTNPTTNSTPRGLTSHKIDLTLPLNNDDVICHTPGPSVF